MKKLHLLIEYGSPAVCGVGQGSRMRSRVRGVSLHDAETGLERLKELTCERCTFWAIGFAARVRRRRCP